MIPLYMIYNRIMFSWEDIIGITKNSTHVGIANNHSGSSNSNSYMYFVTKSFSVHVGIKSWLAKMMPQLLGLMWQ